MSHDKQFSSWLRQRVDSCPQLFEYETRILSHGPLRSVNQYSGCVVNGYRFHTQSREKNRKTQNSGVVLQGAHGENIIDFYGILQEVLEVEYLGENKRVLMFKCDWFKVDDGKGLQIDKESGVKSVNMFRKWYIDQPYILASQAKQVFYAPDLKFGNNWYVVQSYTPRALYDVNVQKEEVHQEQEPHLNLTVDLNMDQLSLTRGIVPLEVLDALTIMAESSRGLSKNSHVEEYLNDEEDYEE